MRRLKLLAAALSLPAFALAQSSDWNEVPLADETYWEQQAEFRSGEYEIPLAAGEALEHKVSMDEGAAVVYAWTVEMPDRSQLRAEFHGHTERSGEEPGTVMFYKIHDEGREQGVLRAPFSGIHGWYFNNASDSDIVVKLKVSGFYREY